MSSRHSIYHARMKEHVRPWFSISDIDTLQQRVSLSAQDEAILREVGEERESQNRQWGEQNHQPTSWLPILVEEVGEVARAMLEGDYEGYRRELIQVAAVVVSAIASYDRINARVKQEEGENMSQLTLSQQEHLIKEQQCESLGLEYDYVTGTCYPAPGSVGDVTEETFPDLVSDEPPRDIYFEDGKPAVVMSEEDEEEENGDDDDDDYSDDDGGDFVFLIFDEDGIRYA